MSVYRQNLPQLKSEIFLTDGGLETTLIFHEGLDLPEFAAFDLLRDKEGADLLRAYFERYIEIARAHNAGFILEAPTWRASPAWGVKLGYSDEALAQINRDAIQLLENIRSTRTANLDNVVISGSVGPRGDGYDAAEAPSVEEARAYHSFQINVFKETSVDLVSAITITTSDEATGIALAARDAELPVCIGFTVETDGKLPNGESLEDAIRTVDQYTNGYVSYFIVNCAHPTHFDAVLQPGSDWTKRIRGVRANASTCSHEELDNAEELDAGDPQDLAARYKALRDACPHITVLGGCCGTDDRHINAIAEVTAQGQPQHPA